MKQTTEYKNQYRSANYDRMNLVVPKGRKREIEAYAREKGVSVNHLVNELLRIEMGIPEAKWKLRSDD